MTNLETLVARAVEGGYSAYSSNVAKGQITTEAAVAALLREAPIEAHLLKPELFRCAGKALGWGSFYNDDGMVRSDLKVYVNGYFPDENEAWMLYWHGLLDALASERTAEAYAGELLAANPEGR